MKMRAILLLGGMLLGVGCSEQQAEEAGAGQANGSATAESEGAGSLATADPEAGINRDDRIYPIAPGGEETSGHEAASEGDGRTAEITASDKEMEELLALKPLNPLGEEVGPKAIIPPKDDRQQVVNTTTYPERAQVLVQLPDGRCSGTMIGKDLVLTAGHCVHSGGSGGAWKASATVYPGRNGRLSPFGSCQARMFYSVVGWVRDRNPNYDFGAIKLNCTVGERTGWLGYFWQTASLIGAPARISGYPGDKQLEQWTHTDRVRGNTATQTSYHTDTMPGNSGSGVFGNTACTPCVHTAHAYGSTTQNSGTRITRPLFENLRRWSAE